jgi:hypothetical protein
MLGQETDPEEQTKPKDQNEDGRTPHASTTPVQPIWLRTGHVRQHSS